MVGEGTTLHALSGGCGTAQFGPHFPTCGKVFECHLSQLSPGVTGIIRVRMNRIRIMVRLYIYRAQQCNISCQLTMCPAKIFCSTSTFPITFRTHFSYHLLLLCIVCYSSYPTLQPALVHIVIDLACMLRLTQIHMQ